MPPRGGTLAAGTYNYRVVFVDPEGNEGAPSAPLPITIGGADDSVTLNSLPPADGSTFVQRRIYRTDNTGTGTSHLVTTIADAATTTSFSDDGSGFGAVLNEDTLAQGTYSYYVTLYNTTTGSESRPAALIGPQAVSQVGQRIRLASIPQPVSSNFTAVRIYRNLVANSSAFHRIADLTGGETSYIDGALDSAISGNPLVNLDGPAISTGLPLVDVVSRDGSTYENPFTAGTLNFTPRKGDATLGTKQLTIASTTTVQDWIDFMDEAMGIQSTSPDPNFPIPTGAGGSVVNSRIRFVANMGAANALDIPLSGLQLVDTSSVTSTINIPFSESQAANGESVMATFQAFDSLGTPLTLRVTTVMETQDGSNTRYRWFADSDDNDPQSGVDITAGTGVITFDSNGNVISVSNTTVSIDRENNPAVSPLEFDLDFSNVSGLATEDSELAASENDGSGAGNLASFVINETGLIRGVFTNGVVRDLAQVRMVRFNNPEGLEQLGQNLFGSGSNSGLPVESNPGQQGLGTMIAGAVELSNTDIGGNLIDLVLASTQYRGGTRVITSVQQLLDELLALRR